MITFFHKTFLVHMNGLSTIHMQYLMKRSIIILTTFLSIGLAGISYAGYLDDWPDDAICSWMEQASPPEYIVDEAIKRNLDCVPDSVTKTTKNESKIIIYDVVFSQTDLDDLLSQSMGKTDYDFSQYKLAKSHNKLQCFFRIRRVVYENKDEGEIEDWNIAEGYLVIDGGKVNIDVNRSRWRMSGLSDDPSYLENEVNLRLTEDGHLVGKMAYFTHHINTGEAPRSPFYVELIKHKKSKPLNYNSSKKESAELWIDVEEWAGGVLLLSNCKKK